MNEWKRISLDGTWQINYVSADQIGKDDTYPCTLSELKDYGENTISGTVPGNFELALEAAGVVPEIFKDDHVLLLQKYEGYHVFYSRKFSYKEQAGYEPEILFEGLDTICEVLVNGKLAGRTENMSIPHVIKPDNLVNGENEIIVHFFPVCLEERKYETKAGHCCLPYLYSALHVRKAPHMYGWDIAPRIVSCGIFRPVALVYRPKEYINQTYLATRYLNREEDWADLCFFFETKIDEADISRYSIELDGECEDSSFHEESRLWNKGGDIVLRLHNPKLWQPKGIGTPYLYDVKVVLKKDGEVIDTYCFKAGIRTVELVRTSFSDEQLSGDFYFKVNGEKVFILGTNFVPADAFHSRDRERLPKTCELLEDVGCNAIRLWGGNIYEDDYLYDYCDEHGILIWQDFMMACGIYPQDKDMQDMLSEEVKMIVRRLRNHPSIIMWAGDNENDTSTLYRRRNPDWNILTRRLIPEILWEEDPFRIYLPSSPYIDKPFREISHPFDFAYPPMEQYTEQHLWGPRDYFRGEYYAKNIANFASEMGYHGCPSPVSVRKFLSEDRVWPWQNNLDWIIHSSSPDISGKGVWDYRIQLMADQIHVLFGEVPDTLEEFSLASQISQAEAMKFFIELFRMGKERRGGIIWWNLIDCWPQFSDAVVDYYYDKKLAFHYIKNCQKPVLLAFKEPEEGQLQLQAINDTGHTVQVRYTVTDYNSGKILADGQISVGDAVENLTKLPYREDEKHIYIIKWESEEGHGKSHYLSGQPAFDLKWYRSFLQETYCDYR